MMYNSKPLIFISAPYRAGTDSSLFDNAIFVRILTIDIWQQGGVAVAPHLNSFMLGGLVPEEGFLQGYCDLLRRCDAVLFAGLYEQSEGCQMELQAAKDSNIPQLFSVKEAREFIQNWT